MLCEKCHAREATVHYTKVDGEKVSKVNLCEECAEGEMGPSKGIELADMLEILKSGKPKAATQLDFLKAALGESTRYPIEAYQFVREALDTCFTGTQVSGQTLLEAIRELALKKFGKQAKAALGAWNIFRTEDFGEMVFEMIDAGLLGKQPEDSKEDFQNGFNFDEAFPES